MKIINVDNFDRDTIDDVLVCENVSEYYGKIIVEMLNDKLSGDSSPNYFRLVDNDHVLYKWEW